MEFGILLQAFKYLTGAIRVHLSKRLQRKYPSKLQVLLRAVVLESLSWK